MESEANPESSEGMSSETDRSRSANRLHQYRNPNPNQILKLELAYRKPKLALRLCHSSWRVRN